MKLKTQEALRINAALSAMDGFDKDVEVAKKGGGYETVIIRKRYDTTSATRTKVGDNLIELKWVLRRVEDKRMELVEAYNARVAEADRKNEGDKIFQDGYKAILEDEVEVDLEPFTKAELSEAEDKKRVCLNFDQDVFNILLENKLLT